MSLTSSTWESTSTSSTTGSTASKNSISLSPQFNHRVMASPPTSAHSTLTTAPLSFGSRRGNMKFSSARYYPTNKSLRSSKRNRGFVSSLRASKRTQRSAPRPARSKAVFDKLIFGLAEGIIAVKRSIEEMKSKLKETITRVNYYMDLEKQMVSLERKVRTLEVHKDRIEEMRDEYVLKIKLREGAFNLAQALANQTSKVAKEKLQETRLEQSNLLEDLCDIEDELETKLGVFKVHINGLVGLSHVGNADGIEAHLRLATQKWKAKCKMSRHEQTWTDEDIIFLGKVADELFVKIVELKKIQGNVHVGTMKCQTREFYSFYPMNVTFNFPSSPVKLNMDVTWSPTLGEDFLTDLDLPQMNCIVGGATSGGGKMNKFGSVERMGNNPLISGHSLDASIQHAQIRIINEPDDTEVSSGNSVGHVEVKTLNIIRRSKRKGKKDDDFVFLDRHSLIVNTEEARQFPEAKHLMDREASPDLQRILAGRMYDLDIASDKPAPHKHRKQDSRDSSLGSSHSSGSGHVPPGTFVRQKTPEIVTVVGMLEVVMAALEEPKDLYPELASLDSQLTRLEIALNGGRLVKIPSMTLSESQAMDSFDFLGSEDSTAHQRFSKSSFSEFTDDYPFLIHRRQSCTFSGLPSSTSRSDHRQSSQDSHTTDDYLSGSDFGSTMSEGGAGVRCEGGSTGLVSVDRSVLQHLIHCDCLLQHLQSAGPLNFKLKTGLLKLQQEAEIIAELLNIAAEPDVPVVIEQIIPELAVNDGLLAFWKYAAGDDLLSVSYEQFAVALDEKFGQIMWVDFPETANKAFTELLSRVLDLEIDDWEPALDSQMVVTVFQYTAYFLVQGICGIQKCLKDVAQELIVTEGLQAYEEEHVRIQIASQLSDYNYNRGALLAAAHLLTDSRKSICESSEAYVVKFSGNSPWHNKAVQFYVELLEHPDQRVRAGACIALGLLQATSAVPQLKYLARKDFAPVTKSAAKALHALGEKVVDATSTGKYPEGGELSVESAHAKTKRNIQPLTRTRSAELLSLTSES